MASSWRPFQFARPHPPPAVNQAGLRNKLRFPDRAFCALRPFLPKKLLLYRLNRPATVQVVRTLKMAAPTRRRANTAAFKLPAAEVAPCLRIVAQVGSASAFLGWSCCVYENAGAQALRVAKRRNSQSSHESPHQRDQPRPASPQRGSHPRGGCK